ncbi:MAG: 4Fe-4S dicluster domain-containing protein [Candidatus Hodarchaeales archaeon]|jgi:heterodisulfide reductase subunit C
MEIFQISADKQKSDLLVKVEKWSDQNVFTCYQCGKCSAACPLTERMDHLPNQVMKLLQMDDEKTLIESNTHWICASCMQCTANCPRGVRITEIMEALRLYHLRQREDAWNINLRRKELKDLPPIAIIANFRKMTS